MEIDARFKVTEQLDGKMLINGELRGSSCDQWLESRCPATQELIGRVPNASADEMTEAVTAAKEASKAWRKTTQKQRVALIEEIAQRLGEEIESQVSDEQLALMVKQKGFAEVSE